MNLKELKVGGKYRYNGGKHCDFDFVVKRADMENLLFDIVETNDRVHPHNKGHMYILRKVDAEYVFPIIHKIKFI